MFCGQSDSYEVFKQFDSDKDGFISRDDLVSTIQKMNILEAQEIPAFLDYVDPGQQQYLNF